MSYQHAVLRCSPVLLHRTNGSCTDAWTFLPIRLNAPVTTTSSFLAQGFTYPRHQPPRPANVTESSTPPNFGNTVAQPYTFHPYRHIYRFSY
jgi:hypothetical protein